MPYDRAGYLNNCNSNASEYGAANNAVRHRVNKNKVLKKKLYYEEVLEDNHNEEFDARSNEAGYRNQNAGCNNNGYRDSGYHGGYNSGYGGCNNGGCGVPAPCLSNNFPGQHIPPSQYHHSPQHNGGYDYRESPQHNGGYDYRESPPRQRHHAQKPYNPYCVDCNNDVSCTRSTHNQCCQCNNCRRIAGY